MKLSKIVLSSGQELEVARGVTAIVGPNNSGKSTLLTELSELLAKHPNIATRPQMKVISGYSIDFGKVKVDDAQSWLERRAGPINQSGYDSNKNPIEEPFFEFARGIVTRLSELKLIWGQQQGLGNFSGWFVRYVGAEGHSSFAQGISVVGASSPQPPSTPIQALFVNPALERSMSKLMKRTFDVDLMLDHSGGGNTSFRLGKTKYDYGERELVDYAKEVSAMPSLDAQGDGIKAFAGLVALVLSARTPLVLIDEPETFLHPPQARKLGQFLASQQFAGTQFIIATHSRDIIDGLISSPRAGSVAAIHRLAQIRHDDGSITNRAASLQSASLKVLNEDPLLHYSGLLSGLFANGTLLCEGDSDCTYLRAVFDRMGTSGILGIHMVNCNGIGAIPKALQAFRKDNVPTAAVVDIDLLRSRSNMARFVNAAGGDIKQIEPLRKKIADEVDAIAGAQVLKSDVKLVVDTLIAASVDTYLDADERAEITRAIKQPKGWELLQKYGVTHKKPDGTYVLSDEGLRVFRLLRTRLRRLGIFMLSVGTLEGFHPEVTSRKSKWTSEVLSKGLYKKNSSRARALLGEIAKYLQEAESKI